VVWVLQRASRELWSECCSDCCASASIQQPLRLFQQLFFDSASARQIDIAFSKVKSSTRSSCCCTSSDHVPQTILSLINWSSKLPNPQLFAIRHILINCLLFTLGSSVKAISLNRYILFGLTVGLKLCKQNVYLFSFPFRQLHRVVHISSSLANCVKEGVAFFSFAFPGHTQFDK